jgi:hypothetical protein
LTPERPGDLIERTRQMYEMVIGQAPELTTDFATAFAALVEGTADIVVELPWDEDRGGEMVERHQIVLSALSDDQSRVLFYNPAAAHGRAPGTELGAGAHQGPPRRVEEDGLESMDLASLARYFAEGKAHALIPPPGMFE